jgi:hypothetical protein
MPGEWVQTPRAPVPARSPPPPAAARIPPSPFERRDHCRAPRPQAFNASPASAETATAPAPAAPTTASAAAPAPKPASELQQAELEKRNAENLAKFVSQLEASKQSAVKSVDDLQKKLAAEHSTMLRLQGELKTSKGALEASQVRGGSHRACLQCLHVQREGPLA